MKSPMFTRLCLVTIFALGFASPDAGAQSAPAPTPQISPEKARALELRDQLVAIGANGDPREDAWDAVRAKIDGYQKEFGVGQATTNNVVLLRKLELSVARKFTDPARYVALLQQFAVDPLPAVAQNASAQLAVQTRLEDLKTKPIELRFTALDGSAVDLAKLRGKVVLIDFWATWCPDCIAEEPGLVELYQKYHDQGFEIVGVSLDEDKAKLLAFIQRDAMAWPEDFDGKKWNNEVGQQFGIASIPAVWLFDKKGLLVTRNGRDNLAGHVAELLKNP